jgi:hypothetical protein
MSHSGNEPVLVDLHQGSQSESWVAVYADGTLEYHCENTGHAFFRHGAQDLDELWTLEQIRHRYPHKLAEVEAALAQLRVQP